MRVLLSLVAVALAISSTSGQTVDDHDKIVVCYYDSFAYYRPDLGRFDIYNIDPSLCTHGMYAFANIDRDTWSVVAHDPFLDLGPEDNCAPGECVIDNYRRFVALKQASASFKPMLTVGGYGFGSAVWSDMAADPAKRALFIQSLLDFATVYGFEGFDIDWEFPSVGAGDETIDKEDYALLMEETRLAFDADGRGLLLTAALAPLQDVVDAAYDVPRVFASVDFATILTYEYHGYYPSQHYVGHPGPLYRRQEEGPGNPGYGRNVFDSLNYMLEKGAPRSKMVMGIAAHGNGFVLSDEGENGLYCDADGPNPGGPWTGADGLWAYHEILYAQNADDFGTLLPGATPGQWTIVTDTCYLAPYMFNGPHWMGYDDEASVGYKVQYANYINLAGAAMWAITLDDFHGTFSAETYPLLRKVNADFTTGISFDPENPNCGSAPMCYYTKV